MGPHTHVEVAREVCTLWPGGPLGPRTRRLRTLDVGRARVKTLLSMSP